MNLEQALSYGGNLVDALADAAWQDLVAEATAVVVYARCQMLLSQALPELAAVESALSEATATTEAAQSARNTANDAWRSQRWQGGAMPDAAEESHIADLRAAWQDAEAALSAARAVQLPLTERRDRLAQLVSQLQQTEKPNLSALSILSDEVQR
jgi:hypothetical protein